MNMDDEPQMSAVIRVRWRATRAQNELISTLRAEDTVGAVVSRGPVYSYIHIYGCVKCTV